MLLAELNLQGQCVIVLSPWITGPGCCVLRTGVLMPDIFVLLPDNVCVPVNLFELGTNSYLPYFDRYGACFYSPENLQLLEVPVFSRLPSALAV